MALPRHDRTLALIACIALVGEMLGADADQPRLPVAADPLGYHRDQRSG